MRDEPRIAVVGSNMIDLITYIDRMPKEGETIEAPRFDMGFGGKGANQAAAAAKLGADVVMLTCVGDDMFGPLVIKNLESFGIDVSHVKTMEHESSGVAPIFVDKQSNNSILIIKGANNCLLPGDIDGAGEALLGSEVIILQLEIPLETVYYAVEFGKKHGIPVILNPAPAAELDFERIKDVSMFVPNESELAGITGMPVETVDEIEKAATKLLDGGIETVIVTMGRRGSMRINQSGALHIKPFAVEEKDSTGAGDAYIGSLACYWIKTGDIETAMDFASKYAGFSIMRPGTQKSFLTKEEFEKALNRQT